MADQGRIGGGTSPYEAMLERKRMAIRRALKMQYIKTIYDPRNYNREGASEFFDANMVRYHAMLNTRHEYFYPTARNMTFFFLTLVIPIGIIVSNLKASSQKYIDNVMGGEWPYDHPSRVVRWKMF